MRILIDCSYVNFSSQPTGISRVVLKYVEVAFDWGERNCIEIIPVVPTSNGLFIVRPLPGRNAPSALINLVGLDNNISLSVIVRQALGITGNYISKIIHHLVFLIASIIPLRVLRKWMGYVDRATHRLLLYPWRVLERHRLKVEETRIKIVPESGDVLFCPAYWHDVDVSIYESLQSRGVKIIVLVHDILPIILSQFYNSPWRDDFKLSVKWAIEYADGLCSVSEATKVTLVEFASQSRLRKPQIMTAYNGYEPLVSAEIIAELERHRRTRKEIIRRFVHNPLIMVGTIEPKKGHVATIQCMEQMWDEGYGRDLIIIGRRGWLEQPIVDKMLMSQYYNKRLFWFDDMDDADLAYAYMHCYALIFSSRGEGFGIPLVEAASYGKPAIVYDTPVAREVLKGLGIFFTLEPGNFMKKLRELEDADFYRAACVATAGVSWPSWDAYTPRVFDHLLAYGRGEPLPETA